MVVVGFAQERRRLRIATESCRAGGRRSFEHPGQRRGQLSAAVAYAIPAAGTRFRPPRRRRLRLRRLLLLPFLPPLDRRGGVRRFHLLQLRPRHPPGFRAGVEDVGCSRGGLVPHPLAGVLGLKIRTERQPLRCRGDVGVGGIGIAIIGGAEGIVATAAAVVGRRNALGRFELAKQSAGAAPPSRFFRRGRGAAVAVSLLDGDFAHGQGFDPRVVVGGVASGGDAGGSSGGEIVDSSSGGGGGGE
mmetsp:Transcript_2000/g.4254  ORF Transcript_2000/g.4254 Transcript_2000/m.4254 type:complete len:245 (-) Transcript_2000:371-1105(-)